ncbi:MULTISPECIES: low molecular weight protein arginine phosphatase [unclassified Staphylococcus]|uniref:low molecular weight protein arginine phosphatase n=1 Tax=unclassified Staphylococcus TaxID=91994 RepID=UPI0021D08806|nr:MULTISPECIES: low molecular weight protein arginine phosphatase [unclassified Staphylococcus]UXR69145.1 low molecular weight protein arginine phosphatase [Staphylococcus sp. IVB6246]UXR71199.1 low molecular weight protein arginine phosphatase [Staphylococcus sp. IVB6240]UXR73472.1 low molecular weight protein arginine phosphatase [Staphylococcus sp. IVB6238]UXR75790.1 low molecular weight protein arginine phosphatase [Staphylococcus sp. IVB6233]UXR79989.1 low molecular weight protein argini
MKVIFVCTGNTCRSPMAEGIARSYLQGHEIFSRGIMAQEGAPIATHTQKLLEQHDHPIPEGATPFSNDDTDADLILTMTSSHAHHIRMLYGESLSVMTLSEYVGETGEVPDPFGGSYETYIETFEQLTFLIQQLQKKLDTELV